MRLQHQWEGCNKKIQSLKEILMTHGNKFVISFRFDHKISTTDVRHTKQNSQVFQTPIKLDNIRQNWTTWQSMCPHILISTTIPFIFQNHLPTTIYPSAPLKYNLFKQRRSSRPAAWRTRQQRPWAHGFARSGRSRCRTDPIGQGIRESRTSRQQGSMHRIARWGHHPCTQMGAQ